MTHEPILNIKDITALGKCITVCFTYNSILSINYLHPNIRLKVWIYSVWMIEQADCKTCIEWRDLIFFGM